MARVKNVATALHSYLVEAYPSDVIPDDLHEQISKGVKAFTEMGNAWEVEKPTNVKEFMDIAERARLLLWFDGPSGTLMCEEREAASHGG